MMQMKWQYMLLINFLCQMWRIYGNRLYIMRDEVDTWHINRNAVNIIVDNKRLCYLINSRRVRSDYFAKFHDMVITAIWWGEMAFIRLWHGIHYTQWSVNCEDSICPLIQLNKMFVHIFNLIEKYDSTKNIWMNRRSSSAKITQQ